MGWVNKAVDVVIGVGLYEFGNIFPGNPSTTVFDNAKAMTNIIGHITCKL